MAFNAAFGEWLDSGSNYTLGNESGNFRADLGDWFLSLPGLNNPSHDSPYDISRRSNLHDGVSIQISFTRDRRFGEIDIDFFDRLDSRHYRRQNSDIISNLDRFQSVFGDPGFSKCQN